MLRNQAGWLAEDQSAHRAWVIGGVAEGGRGSESCSEEDWIAEIQLVQNLLQQRCAVADSEGKLAGRGFGGAIVWGGLGAAMAWPIHEDEAAAAGWMGEKRAKFPAAASYGVQAEDGHALRLAGVVFLDGDAMIGGLNRPPAAGGTNAHGGAKSLNAGRRDEFCL